MERETPVTASLNKRVMYPSYESCILFLDTPRKDLTAGDGVGVGAGQEPEPEEASGEFS